MSKKIKKIEDFGIPLDENIKEIINKAYSQYNNKSAFADAIGIDRTTACFILGTKTRQAKYISWDKWPKIRDYLASVGLLDASDPRWRTPDELRGDASYDKRPRSVRYREAMSSSGPMPSEARLMPDDGSSTIEFVTSSPKRFYWEGVPHSSPSSSDFLSFLMSCPDIPADVKVTIFQAHEKFLFDLGNKRQDMATEVNVPQISTKTKIDT